MGSTAFLLLLFGLSIFIVPSEGVTSCVQCAEIHDSQLEPFWKQMGGVIDCGGRSRTPCKTGLLAQRAEFMRLVAGGKAAGADTISSSSFDYFAKGLKGRQGGGGMDQQGGCVRMYLPPGAMGGETQLWMGCMDQGGPRNPCPSKSGCGSQKHGLDDPRPSRPSDMGTHIITCACQYEGCNPDLKHEINDNDRGGCGGGGGGAGLTEPLKISLFLGLLLASLL